MEWLQPNGQKNQKKRWALLSSFDSELQAGRKTVDI